MKVESITDNYERLNLKFKKGETVDCVRLKDGVSPDMHQVNLGTFSEVLLRKFIEQSLKEWWGDQIAMAHFIEEGIEPVEIVQEDFEIRKVN